MGKSIGVISLKGGVGKTSTVVSLGAALSDFGKKVLLVDGNLSAPNLGLHLNVVNPEKTLHDVLDRSSNLKDAIHKLENFDILPAAIFTNKEVAPLALKSKINFLKKSYDIILIDSSPAQNDETLAVILAADELLIVTTPDHPALSTTIKAIKKAKQRGRRISGLVLNKVYKKDFELSIEDIEKTVGVPVLAVIPHDVNFFKSLSKFIPFTDYKPNSEGSIEFKKLAAVLIGEKYKPFRARRFFRIGPKRQEINRELFYNKVFG